MNLDKEIAVDIYLILKNNYLRLFIDPTESDMENAEVLMRRLNVSNLFQAGFPLIQKANDLIYLEADVQNLLPEKLMVHSRLADIFELDVPGILMTSWQIARIAAKEELMKDICSQPEIL